MSVEWVRTIGGYEVSEIGQVRSVNRFVPCRGGKRLVEGRVLKPFVCKNTGYLQVMIARKKYSVHRLIAEAFCGAHTDDQVVNHKDGNRQNNVASNLEWITRSENIRHAYRVLGIKNSMKGRFSAEHPSSKPVVSQDIRSGEVKYYASAMDAVREGFNSSCISRCCSGQNASHKGRHWYLVEPGVTFGDGRRVA